jgi:hypothetical protein
MLRAGLPLRAGTAKKSWTSVAVPIPGCCPPQQCARCRAHVVRVASGHSLGDTVERAPPAWLEAVPGGNRSRRSRASSWTSACCGAPPVPVSTRCLPALAPGPLVCLRRTRYVQVVDAVSADAAEGLARAILELVEMCIATNERFLRCTHGPSVATGEHAELGEPVLQVLLRSALRVGGHSIVGSRRAARDLSRRSRYRI